MSGELTDEEAIELARRWIWWHDGGVDREKPSTPLTVEKSLAWIDRMAKMCVNSEDMERLLGWVNRECERGRRRGCTLGVGCDDVSVCYAEASGCPERCGREYGPWHIAARLGIDVDAAEVLVEQARAR